MTRICKHAGCTTRLSRYNPLEYCEVHRHHADDPYWNMSYGTRSFGFCPVCEEVKAHREYNVKERMCNACVRARQYEQELLGPTRVCPRCGKRKPNTGRYWEKTKRPCRECIAAAARERARKRAEVRQ